MAIAAFLPLVGVTAVALPAGIWLYVTGHPIAAVGLVGFNLLQGSIIENVVKTKLLGSAMRMHDLLVFLAMLGGIAAFGILGLVYGPLIAMLFMTLTDLYLKVYRPKLSSRFAGRV
jgi:predicted PurR-regulated permease PerM